MGHAPSIATRIISQFTSEISSQDTLRQDTSRRDTLRQDISLQDISPSRRQNRKSLFAHIIDALHHSRRLQAERTLRQYRHLIDRAHQPGTNDAQDIQETIAMSTNEGLVRCKSSVQVPHLTERVLLVTILLLFLLLHVLAGAMLMHSNTGHRATSTQDIQDMQLRLHD